MNSTSKRLNSLVSLVGIVCGFGAATSSAEAQASGASSSSIVEVTANGTGCPAGTWETEIGADGLSVTATFTGFSATVDADKTIDVKDCVLAIAIANSEAFSYAVDSVTFSGSASLAAGVTAKLMAQAYVQGSTSPGANGTSELSGPFEGDLNRSIVLGSSSGQPVPWSPCGAERNLNVTTRISLRNATDASSSSSVDLTTNDPESDARITVQLAAREC